MSALSVVKYEDNSREKAGLQKRIDETNTLGQRYTHKVSAALAEELQGYIDDVNSVTDCRDEIALLRFCVSEDLRVYSYCLDMPNDTVQEKTARRVAIQVAKEDLQASIGKVIISCKTMAEIQKNKEGKFDGIMVAALAGAVAGAVDRTIHGMQEKLTAAGVDPQALADTLASAISEDVNKESGGYTVDNKPATVKADDILKQMMKTVPVS